MLVEWKKIIKLGKTDFAYQNTLKPYLERAYNMYISEGVKTKTFDELENTILDSVSASSNALVLIVIKLMLVRMQTYIKLEYI